MNTIQILLTAVVIVLTILLIIVGVEVLSILMDVRKSVRKLNSLLEDTLLGGGLIRPDKLTNLMEFFRRKKHQGDQQV